MKKLLLSTISLLLFSISILIFDISCKKESIAQTDTTPQPLGIMFYSVAVRNPVTNKTTYQIWKCNYDGSNKTKIDFVLPEGSGLGNISPSPDGKRVFFNLWLNNPTNDFWICSVNTDGTGFTKLVKVDDDVNSGVVVI